MRKRKYIDDLMSRMLKTFVQAFCGVCIPEIVALLNGEVPFGDVTWAILTPILASSFAAALSACWNLLNNHLIEEQEREKEEEEEWEKR